MRDWRDTLQAAQASTVEHMTPDYPAAFITDGNEGSFEPDAQKLEAKLRGNGVYVASLYYSAERGKLGTNIGSTFPPQNQWNAITERLLF